MRYFIPIIFVLMIFVATVGCFSNPEQQKRATAAKEAANNLDLIISDINKNVETDMVSTKEAVLPKGIPVILRGYMLGCWTQAGVGHVAGDYTWIDPEENDYVFYDLVKIQNSTSILVIQEKSEEIYGGEYYTKDSRRAPVEVYKENVILAVYELPSRKYIGKKEITANIPADFMVSAGYVGRGRYTYPASKDICDWIKSRNN